MKELSLLGFLLLEKLGLLGLLLLKEQDRAIWLDVSWCSMLVPCRMLAGGVGERVLLVFEDVEHVIVLEVEAA